MVFIELKSDQPKFHNFVRAKAFFSSKSKRLWCFIFILLTCALLANFLDFGVLVVDFGY